MTIFDIPGDLAWVAAVSNYYQSLTVRLDRRYNISAIVTQGRRNSQEYVSEYVVQSSDDGFTWKTYQSDANQDEVVDSIQSSVASFDFVTFLSFPDFNRLFQSDAYRRRSVWLASPVC